MRHDNELVISTWSPIHLRDKLKKLYWRDGKDLVGAMAFWEDTRRYLYFPRLDERHVLEQAAAGKPAGGTFSGPLMEKQGQFLLVSISHYLIITNDVSQHHH